MNIKLKKDEGFIQYAFCIMLFSICALLILYSVRMRIVQEQKKFIEDGISESALASIMLNLNEYGTYNYVRSGSNNYWDEEEDLLLETFVENLKTNLKLDSNLYPNANNTIITSQVKIAEFWIYNKRLIDVKKPDGSYELVRDYYGNWVRRHRQVSTEWYILKYTAKDENGIAKPYPNGRIINDFTSAGGTPFTPEDNNIITAEKSTDRDGSNVKPGVVDGAGGGNVPVESMTIYASVQFDINPFGYNKNDTYKGGLFGVGSLIGDTTITKSVVVSIHSLPGAESDDEI